MTYRAPELEPDSLKRMFLKHTLPAMAIGLGIVSILDYLQALYINGVIHLVAALIGIVVMWMYKKNHNVNLIISYVILLGIISIVSSFIISPDDDTLTAWILIYPILFYFMCGIKWGTIHSFLLLAFYFFYFYLPPKLSGTPYVTDHVFFSSLLEYLLLMILGFFFEVVNKQYQNKLADQARSDFLTGIYNRRAFNEAIEIQIKHSRRFSEKFSMIIFDIDHFKKVNDTLGHDIGDVLLVEITSVVKKELRKSDLFARWGGEEFVVLARQTSLKEVLILAERIRTSIEQYPFPEAGKITASFGATQYIQEIDNTASDLLIRADKALYRAKEAGRNKVLFVQEPALVA